MTQAGRLASKRSRRPRLALADLRTMMGDREISGLEDLLLKVGQAVVKQAAMAWLSARVAERRRAAALTDLVVLRFSETRQQREFRRRIEEIEEAIVEQLAPLCAQEYRDLGDNEKEAAILAVADLFEEATLSDATLFRVDMRPDSLAQEILEQLPRAARAAGLSESAQAFFDLLMVRTCHYLANLVLELPEFQPRAALETLRRLSELSSQVATLLDRVPLAITSKTSEDVLDLEYRQRYFDTVGAVYDRLELLGITTNYYEPRTTLSVAYLSLTALAGDSQARRQPPKGDFDKFGRAEYPTGTLRVEEALGARRRVLVQGDAGAGKTTLLHWLAVTAVRGRLLGGLASWNGHVPILLRLRDFAGRDLPQGDEMVSHENAPSCGPVPDGWVHRVLESGNALLLVDGVDELPENQRVKVREWLMRQLASYPQAKIVVTSRPSAVSGRWLASEGFDTVTLQPMTRDDIRVFISRWHSALLHYSDDQDVLPCEREEVPWHERTLIKSLEARRHLQTLARNPLLCAMLCALNLDRRANLPRDRMALYEAGLDMLLERRDVEKQISTTDDVDLTATEKRALLKALAWWLNENGRTDMSGEEAQYQLQIKIAAMPNVSISPNVALRYLLERSGLLRQPVYGRIDFVHRTFQEFLAAKEAVERYSIGLLVNNAHSDVWRETVMMACAHATPVQRGELLTGILDRAYGAEDAAIRRQLQFVAVSCLDTVVEAPVEVLERVEECVLELVPPRDFGEATALASISDILLHRLPTTLDGLSESSARATIRVAALANGPDALQVLAAFASIARDDVQEELLACWQYFDIGEYARVVLANAPLFDGSLQVTDPAWLDHLGELQNLRSVNIRVYPERIADLLIFEHLPQVKSIFVRVIGDCDVTPLGACEQLTYLNLQCDGEFRALESLASIRSLRTLVLNPGARLASVGFLAGMTWLTRLELVNLSVWDDDVIVGLSHLRSIAVRNATVPVDCSVFAELVNLTKVDLRGCTGDVDLRSLPDTVTTVWVNRGQQLVGTDLLSPSVAVEYF